MHASSPSPLPLLVHSRRRCRLVQMWLGRPCEKRNDFEAQASRIVLDAHDTDMKDVDLAPRVTRSDPESRGVDRKVELKSMVRGNPAMSDAFIVQ